MQWHDDRPALLYQNKTTRIGRTQYEYDFTANGKQQMPKPTYDNI